MGSVAQSGTRRVVLRYSHHVAVALAVRDALGLDDLATDVALVCPAVPLISAAPEQRPLLRGAWLTWWHRVLAAAPATEYERPLAPGGILGSLLQSHLPGLLDWSRQRKREVAAASKPDPTHRLAAAIKAHEQATGQRIHAFRLQVTALPVQGILFAPVSPSPVSPALVFVSTDLLHQRSDYHARILAHVTSAS